MAAHDDDVGDGGAGAWSRWRVDVLLFLVVLAATAPTVQLLMAHQASRLALTAAVWDQGTVQIDDYGPGLLQGLGPRDSGGILSVDYAQRDGHLYSDKAPGQPFLALPFYGIARLAGAEPGVEVRYFDNLTLWWTSLWSAAIPAAVLAVLMRRVALRVTGDRPAATAAAAAMSLGTLLLPFGTVLFSHVLAATLAFGAYVLAGDRDATPARLAVAGLLGGLAVVTEYTAGIVVVVVGLLVLRRHRSGVVSYVAGGLPAAALLGVYNTIVWGGPTEFSYDYSGAFGDFHAQGLFGIRVPDPVLTMQVLFGERGLFVMTPVVLVGVIGLVALARDARTRDAGVVGLVVFAAFVAIQGGWFSVTAGASPGPRYAVTALPFVAVGVARMWRWSPAGVLLTGGIGAVVMAMAIMTNPLAQPTETFTAGHWALRIARGSFGQNLLTPHIGAPAGQLVQVGLVVALLALLWRTTAATVAPAGAGDAEVAQAGARDDRTRSQPRRSASTPGRQDQGGDPT